MRSRIVAMPTARLRAVGFGSFLTANPSSAADRTQYCWAADSNFTADTTLRPGRRLLNSRYHMR
jgi:hypothetical protein